MKNFKQTAISWHLPKPGGNFQFCTQGIVIYILLIYQKSKFFLCSKNSPSGPYSLIMFTFQYICKSFILIFGYNAIYETDWFVYHLKKSLKKKLCHDIHSIHSIYFCHQTTLSSTKNK